MDTSCYGRWLAADEEILVDEEFWEAHSDIAANEVVGDSIGEGS